MDDLSLKKTGKSEVLNIPCSKKLKNNPAGVGVVLFSSFLCLNKTPKLSRSNESKQPSPQSSNNHVSNVAKKLAFKVESTTSSNSDVTKMKTKRSNKAVATKVTPAKSTKKKKSQVLQLQLQQTPPQSC